MTMSTTIVPRDPDKVQGVIVIEGLKGVGKIPMPVAFKGYLYDALLIGPLAYSCEVSVPAAAVLKVSSN